MKKYKKSPKNQDFIIWQEIIAKTLSARCHHLVREEKKKLINKITKLLNEEF